MRCHYNRYKVHPSPNVVNDECFLKLESKLRRILVRFCFSFLGTFLSVASTPPRGHFIVQFAKGANAAICRRNATEEKRTKTNDGTRRKSKKRKSVVLKNEHWNWNRHERNSAPVKRISNSTLDTTQ